MRETKDSGVDWIGEVPVNWEIVPIKADVSIGHGSDPTTPGDIPVWGSGGEPFKTCGEHKNGPAVLLGRKGTLDCPQLVTGLYWNVDTAFDAKITSKKLSLKFFYYAATCVDIKPYMTNTAKPSMTQFDWDNSRIPRPPLAEQRRIISYLDERCAAIDEDVAKRRDVIGKLKEYKKSLIAHAVTKGLDPDAEMRDSGVEWIGEVPADWEIVPVKADVAIGHGSDPVLSGDIPVWGSGNEPFKTCGEYKEGPVILLGRKGTLDCPQLVVGRYWNVDTAFDAKIKSGNLDLKFFYYAATCIDIKPYATNTAKPSMTQFDWANSKIARPPLSEQRRIVSYLDERCADIDEAISRQEQLIEKLGEYRRSIIHHAVAGKIDCSEA